VAWKVALVCKLRQSVARALPLDCRDPPHGSPQVTGDLLRGHLSRQNQRSAAWHDPFGLPGWKDEFGIAHEIAEYYLQPMNTISLKLPDRLLERLEAASRARGTTKSSLVRECLEQLLDARPAGGKATCYDLASDLAGSLKGLPRRLATNPKYMKGFGQ
jgi:hypothetical protein